MLNLLIAENDIFITKQLINDVLYYIPDIRLVQITNNEEETLKVLNNTQIDIVILDYEILYFGIDAFYEKLENNARQNYKNSIIIISSTMNIGKKFNNNDLVIDYFLKNFNTEKIILKMNDIIKNKDNIKTKKKIFSELEYIHYNVKYKGTQYLADVILYIFNNTHLHINNLQKQVYPIIAKKYNQSVNTFRCNITCATTHMYCDCDSKTLKNFFGLLDDEKPTIKEVVYTILDKINT